MPLANNVTRFPIGLNNLPDNDILANMAQPDPTRYHSFYEDFDLFLATMWGTGGVGTPTRALVAGNGGLLSVATSAADNDNSWIQGSIGYTAVAGKRLFFRARASVDDAVQSDLALGLQIVVAANNFLTPVDGIFFRKADDAATIALVSRAASVETTSGAIGTIVTSQQFEVAFAYDGHSNIIAAAFQANTANGPATIVGSIIPAALPSVPMGVVAAVQAGTAAIRTMQLDQLYAARDR
jgi:hypothetical protein